jgi:hypothetical protein
MQKTNDGLQIMRKECASDSFFNMHSMYSINKMRISV